MENYAHKLSYYAHQIMENYAQKLSYYAHHSLMLLIAFVMLLRIVYYALHKSHYASL